MQNSDLIKELNKYLAANVDMTVKSIETFQFVPVHDIGRIDSMTPNLKRFQTEIPKDTKNCRKLFGIRVWLIKNATSQSVKGQVVDVYHYVPKKRITGFSHAAFFIQNEHQRIASLSNLQTTLQELEFESSDEVLAEINADLMKSPNYGDIINIETVKMPLRMNEYSVNVENIEWPQEMRGFVFILRVYVLKSEQQSTQQVQIDVQDFIPNMQTWDSPLAIPDFESFTRYSLSLFVLSYLTNVFV